MHALSLIVTSLLALQAAPAAQTAAAIGARIAFVDTGEVLRQTEEGKKEIATIEKAAEDKGAELEARGTELQELRAVFTQQAASMNPTARAEAQEQIVEKERVLARLQEDFNAEINILQNRLLQRMADSIREVVGEHARAHGIGVVFVLSPGMPFVADSVDITADVIALYNQKHPVTNGN